MQFGNRLLAPSFIGCIRRRQQVAAKVRVLFDKRDASPASRRSQGGGKASGARTHNQHVTEFVAVFIAAGVRRCRGRAEARGPADEMLVEHPGAFGGAHEGFVVETRLEQRRQD